ncbi:MAG: hypothetical protein K0S76_2131 [Herbinix sp.]|jgi:ABC-type bacteriocin/lantibiotic exporter with double-glycine peptidase domain|nr:hypothetical protein [Herbinix sp.]
MHINNSRSNVCFDPYLKKIGYINWIKKSINIPFSIITASLISEIVTLSIDAKVMTVIKYSIIITALMIALKVTDMLFDIYYKRSLSIALHKCKMLLYNQIMSNPLSTLFKAQSGNLLENINEDFIKFTSIYIALYPSIGVGIISALGYSFFLFTKSYIIAITLLIFSLLQLLPPLIVKKFIQINYDRTRDVEAEITNTIVSAYDGLAEIKIFHAKQWYIDRLQKMHERYLEIGNKGELTGASRNSMNALVDNLLKYGMYAAIGLYIVFGVSTLKVGIEAIALSTGLYAGIKTIFDTIPDLALAKTAEKRLLKWYENEDKSSQILKDGDIILKDISYRYDDKLIFINAYANICNKKIILIKGDNGSGKTTLIQLITGILNEQDGVIKVGGCSPSELDLSEWGRGIFYLPQFDSDFNFTAAELIEMVFHECIAINLELLHEFGLSDQLINDTKIVDLSGGERKKVFLSLALMYDPLILILDEPTNSLDNDSKTILYKKIKLRNKVTLIVSHDQAFDNIADAICRCEKGGIICEYR